MTWPRNPLRARPSRPGGFKFSSGAWLALALALGVILVGCAAPAAQSATPDYPATIQFLMATVEPAEPPTSAAMTTPDPPTATSPPDDTPAPTATLRPTYTPHPRPTPAASSEPGEREPAIPFEARRLNGADLVLSDTIGTPTLLAFWAPW